MKKVTGIIGQLIILIFAALVVGYTSSLTFILAARVVPDNIFLQAMTVVLFDGGALVWFVMFVTRANSIWQWALAAISWIISMAGVALMAGGELLMSQQLFEFKNQDQLGVVLVVACIAAAIYHAIAIYLFHFTDAKILNHIEDETSLASQEQAVLSAARADMESGNDPRLEEMKDVIKDAWQQKMTARMLLSASGYKRSATVIDAESRQILKPRKGQQALPSFMPQRQFALDVEDAENEIEQDDMLFASQRKKRNPWQANMRRPMSAPDVGGPLPPPTMPEKPIELGGPANPTLPRS